MYRLGVCSSKFYSLSKNTEKGALKAHNFSRDLVNVDVAKAIAGILKPLVGRSQHHAHNTQHFIEQIKDVTWELVTNSYDVTALFT